MLLAGLLSCPVRLTTFFVGDLIDTQCLSDTDRRCQQDTAKCRRPAVIKDCPALQVLDLDSPIDMKDASEVADRVTDVYVRYGHEIGRQ